MPLAQSAGVVEYTELVSTPNEHPAYDTKQSDSETPVMLELWGVLSSPSLLSFPGQLWPWVVAPDKIISMGQIELFDI